MAADEDPRVELRHRAEDILSRLSGLPDKMTLEQGRALVKELRSTRDFATLIKVAEAVVRQAPKDSTTRKYYAQALIETGHAVVAVDVLRHLLTDRKESTEAYGLIGRANKQIFLDAGDKSSPAARDALRHALAAYRAPFDESHGKSSWHGVNLLAVLIAARRIGLRYEPDLKPQALATQLIQTLAKTPRNQRDVFYHGTIAEANLALRNWAEVEGNLRQYVAGESIDAFALGSTLRQFTEVWQLDDDEEHGQPLLDILRARLLTLPCATLNLSPADVRRLASTVPPTGTPEAVLGRQGPQTYQWMMNGMKRALSVGSIRRTSDGRRHGSCFVVRAGMLNLKPADELVILTNHHVVNPDGTGIGIQPTAAEAHFEALENAPRIGLVDVLWTSPQEALDASVVRLSSPPGIAPLEAGKFLPTLTEPQGVNIIGYPGGDELAVSFQDNRLIDHEGPPAGKPTVAGRVRLHYRTPTLGGSSGSPVFNEEWQVVGLHHYGGKEGVERLNGNPGSYAANEGIWIQSIMNAPK